MNNDKKILVVSHERSGTHFLIDSIAYNFGYSNNVINFPTQDSKDFSKKRTAEYRDFIQSSVRPFYSLKTDRIFKSHHDVRFFDGMLEELKDNFYIFYIKREACDVLTSCYHYYNLPHLTHFPQEKNVEKFIFELKPYQYATDGAYSFIKSENQILRWKNHVEGWEKSGATILEYNNLKNNFVDCLKVISNVLKIPYIAQQSPPVGGVFPRKGVVGDHKNLFNSEQIQRINSLIA